MKILELKKILKNLKTLKFKLPNSHVPDHFHITEMGLVIKNFIDCGGCKREASTICFQLWTADDFDHRLSPKKFLSIIDSSEQILKYEEDLSVEVEYQGETIGIWELDFKNNIFYLLPKKTNCLAKEKCGLSIIQKEECCNTNCC